MTRTFNAVVTGALMLAALVSGWWLPRTEEVAPKPDAARWSPHALESLRDGSY